jgi:hypothetical protein
MSNILRAGANSSIGCFVLAIEDRANRFSLYRVKSKIQRNKDKATEEYIILFPHLINSFIDFNDNSMSLSLLLIPKICFFFLKWILFIEANIIGRICIKLVNNIFKVALVGLIPTSYSLRRGIGPEKGVSCDAGSGKNFSDRNFSDRRTIVVAHTLGPQNIFFFFSFSGIVCLSSHYH